MTKGTEEWYEQITKINDEVLGLVTLFPELADYLELDTNGMYSISKEGLDK
jgi:hypothetical protein